MWHISEARSPCFSIKCIGAKMKKSILAKYIPYFKGATYLKSLGGGKLSLETYLT